MPFGFGNFRTRKSRTASNTRQKRGREPAKVRESDKVGSSAKIDDSIMMAPLRCLAANPKILEGCPKAPDTKKQPIVAALRSASATVEKKPEAPLATADVLKKKTLEKKTLESKIRGSRKADAAQVWLDEALKLAHQELTGGGVKSAKEASSAISKNNQIEVGEVKLKYYGDYVNKPETGYTLKVKIPRHDAEEGKPGTVDHGLSWIYHNPESTFTGTTKASRVESWATINKLPPQLVVHIYRFDYIAGEWKDAQMIYPEELEVPLSEEPESDDSWQTKNGPTYRLCGIVAQPDAKTVKFEAYVAVPTTADRTEGAPVEEQQSWLRQDSSGKTSFVTKEVAMGQTRTASLLFYTQIRGPEPNDDEDATSGAKKKEDYLDDDNADLVGYLLGEKTSEDFTEAMGSPLVKKKESHEEEEIDADEVETSEVNAKDVIVID